MKTTPLGECVPAPRISTTAGGEAIRSYDDEARYLRLSPTHSSCWTFLEPRTPTNNAPNTFFAKVLRLRVSGRDARRRSRTNQTDWGKTLLWFSGKDPIGCQSPIDNRRSGA